jgi:hypothetical protein
VEMGVCEEVCLYVKNRQINNIKFIKFKNKTHGRIAHPVFMLGAEVVTIK